MKNCANKAASNLFNALAEPATQSAASLADDLAALLFNRDTSMNADILAGLHVLGSMLEATPTYFVEEISYLRNRLASISRQTESAEWGAALYEMRELARKLRRWGGGDDSDLIVPADGPSPMLPTSVAGEAYK